MKFNKFKKSTRFLAITIALLTLALSLPITAFAADDVEPQYSIIHTPDGGTMSVDPNVVKVDEISGYLFEDPLGSSRSAVEQMSRSSVNYEEKGNYTVTEGDDFWIQTPTEAVGTVAWSVSNSYLASVDSSGTVYVNTAGAFYVLANFTDANGNNRYFKYNVLIELPNGVYKFKNKASNLYIELSAGNIAEGADYILWSEESNRNSEFKITDVGTGVYTIRSMVASHVGFSKSSANRLVNAVVETGPVTDPNNEAYIVDEDLWGIASSSQGYYIYNITGGLAGRYTITPLSDTVNSKLELDYKDGSTNQYWSFISVAPIKHGVEIRNSTDTLAVGDTFQFTATMYSSYFNVHGQHPIKWTASPGTGRATIDNDTGLLTGVSPGTVTVTAIYMHSNTSLRWVASMTVTILSNDPFAPENIDYVRYKRIQGADWWGLGADTDHTISIVKSELLADEYFIAKDNINGNYSREYLINSELINTLNALESGYQAHYSPIEAFDISTDQEKTAHYMKAETDQLVNQGHFAVGSSEYYGVWAYNYTSALNLIELWRGTIDTAAAAYDVYLTLMTFYYSHMAVNNITYANVTASQYSSAASYLDDIDNALDSIQYTNRTTVSAKSRNDLIAGLNPQLAYVSDSPVVKFETVSETKFVRVYSKDSGNQIGRWMMKAEDIKGLTPVQIKDKYALAYIPDGICDVTIPAGTTIYTGVASQNAFGSGTGIQFELESYPQNSWFLNFRNLSQ